MSVLPHEHLLRLHAAAVSAGLRDDRNVLLAGIAPSIIASLPQAANTGAQTLGDLIALNSVAQLPDGTSPFAIWLSNACALTDGRRESELFREALEVVTGSTARRSPSVPSYSDDNTRRLSQQIESARDRRHQLQKAGAATEEVDDEIRALRRKLREGGQLHAGDSLHDGRFLLLSRLGRGGFGVVWCALDRDQDRKVAIKVLHGELAGDVVRRERFYRGVRAMAQLDHEAVVRVLHPPEEDGGFHYFVMELVPGGDLRRAVLEGRVKGGAVLDVVLRIGDALAAAHDKGMVHRDVKPANILLDASGAPRLTDFDLVGHDDTTGGTGTGAMGTLIYAAPELLQRPQDADARADVYGLAMTAVFGFHGAELSLDVLRSTRDALHQLTISSGVKAVLGQALDWNRDLRFAGARELCQALREAIARDARLADKSVVSATEGLGFFEGAWVARDTGSNYYGRIIRDKLRVGYCYRGDDHLTAEFYACRFLPEGMLAIRFRWFDREIAGYGFLRIVEPNTLKGGWWYEQDVPVPIANNPDALHETLPKMKPWVLERQDDPSYCPTWAEDYFQFTAKTRW